MMDSSLGPVVVQDEGENVHHPLASRLCLHRREASNHRRVREACDPAIAVRQAAVQKQGAVPKSAELALNDRQRAASRRSSSVAACDCARKRSPGSFPDLPHARSGSGHGPTFASSRGSAAPTRRSARPDRGSPAWLAASGGETRRLLFTLPLLPSWRRIAEIGLMNMVVRHGEEADVDPAFLSTAETIHRRARVNFPRTDGGQSRCRTSRDPARHQRPGMRANGHQKTWCDCGTALWRRPGCGMLTA